MFKVGDVIKLAIDCNAFGSAGENKTFNVYIHNKNFSNIYYSDAKYEVIETLLYGVEQFLILNPINHYIAINEEHWHPAYFFKIDKN